MKAFVTGGTGFIGSHLVETLIRQGFDVTCLVRNAARPGYLDGVKAAMITGDCTKPDSLPAAVKGCDYVFHLAGLTKAKNEEQFFTGNAFATQNVLQAVLDHAPELKRFFYLSSLAAAGPSPDGVPLKEDCETHPVSAYGRTKLEGEKIVYEARDKIPVTIIRPPAVYGPRDRDVLIFFKMVKRGVVPFWGKSLYSFLYVEDLVNGIIQSALSENAAGEIFFLSDGNIYTSDDIINAISGALQRRPLKLNIPRAVMPMVGYLSQLAGHLSIISSDRMKDIQHQYWVCDSAKSQSLFGYAPKVDIQKGASWTADWYRINQWI
ncbi:MAG: NAD-dependent epimerase/dehydratase family protein/3-beta hydroxysteroid dehydrogenase/isomerase [Nitrospirae bacterium]|nr:MAG: NAD-dependent epimerase/dehydratase family protein/3-beta hydroxysteroid dehydrogenase/isomerase [Nitrospirota bacterium]